MVTIPKLKEETPQERELSEARYRAWVRHEEAHSELVTPNAADIDEGDEEGDDE